MPYSEVGYVKNATKDALLNLEIKEGKEARLVLFILRERIVEYVL